MLEKDKYIRAHHNDGGKRRVYHYAFFGVAVAVYRDDIIREEKGWRNEVRWLAMCNKTNDGFGDYCLAEGDTKKEVLKMLNSYTQETLEKELNQSETRTKLVETDVVIRKKGRLVLKARTRELVEYDPVNKKTMGVVSGGSVADHMVEHRLYLDGEHCGNLNITPTAIVELFKEDK